MAQSYLAAAKQRFEQLPKALQADLNISYSYRQLIQLPETSPTRLQNQYFDAFQKAVISGQQQATWQQAQQQAKKLCQKFEAFPKLQRATKLVGTYRRFKAHYPSWSLTKLQQENQNFEQLLAVALKNHQAQIFDQALTVLLRFAHTPSDVRQRPPLQKIYQDLKKALLANDSLASRQNTVLLNNLLTISVSVHPTTIQLKHTNLTAAHAVVPVVTGTPGLTLKKPTPNASPLYFMT